MNTSIETDRALYDAWKQEESIAHIRGWDFSHIKGRQTEEPLPWDYRAAIARYLTGNAKLLDYDTGGGEFLLSLGHPYENTAATEGYAPNAELCRRKLLPLGIDFRVCSDPSAIPFGDESFDLLLNRHGSFNPAEVRRLLKPGGLFITEQVGADNDKDMTEFVLPGTPLPFPQNRLDIQSEAFRKEGFEILEAAEAYRPMRFLDTGAFVWFARIIEWEFPGFGVDRCFERLLQMQQLIERDGFFEGTLHRFLLVARK